MNRRTMKYRLIMITLFGIMILAISLGLQECHKTEYIEPVEETDNSPIIVAELVTEPETEPELIIETTVATEPETEPTETEPVEEFISLGEFRITAYCPCGSCSGGYGNNTSTGVKAKEGRTIAVDPRVIPYGSVIKIGDNEYVAEDCGGAIKGNRIDIFYESHSTATSYGVQYHEIYMRR